VSVLVTIGSFRGRTFGQEVSRRPPEPDTGGVRTQSRGSGRALSTSPFVKREPVVHSTAEFSVGDRVTLDSRGMGRVVGVTEEYVVVDFGVSGRWCVPAGAKGFSRL
jgi:hypothetical protein